MHHPGPFTLPLVGSQSLTHDDINLLDGKDPHLETTHTPNVQDITVYLPTYKLTKLSPHPDSHTGALEL